MFNSLIVSIKIYMHIWIRVCPIGGDCTVFIDDYIFLYNMLCITFAYSEDAGITTCENEIDYTIACKSLTRPRCVSHARIA